MKPEEQVRAEEKGGEMSEKVATYQVTIYVGLQEGYEGAVHNIAELADVCQRYCDEVGLCVTVMPLEFIYTSGREKGAAVGLINYPRFPSTPGNIKRRALELAEKLHRALGQYRISVVTPTETILVS